MYDFSVDRSLVSNSNGRINCVSLNNQPCQARLTLVNINSNQLLYYPYTVSINKCGGSCNSTNDQYALVCVQTKVKHLNVKVLNLMSGVTETKFLVQHESLEFKCGLNESGCNSKQKWNHGNIGVAVKI